MKFTTKKIMEKFENFNWEIKVHLYAICSDGVGKPRSLHFSKHRINTTQLGLFL
jgi:hypothetical protein